MLQLANMCKDHNLVLTKSMFACLDEVSER